MYSEKLGTFTICRVALIKRNFIMRIVCAIEGSLIRTDILYDNKIFLVQKQTGL